MNTSMYNVIPTLKLKVLTVTVTPSLTSIVSRPKLLIIVSTVYNVIIQCDYTLKLEITPPQMP